MERKNPIEEAKRYLQNAKDILREKAVKDGNSYTDSKYVKMAGDTAWKGCLIALDAVFHVRESLPKGRRVSVDHYRDKVARKDRKMLTCVVDGYNILHLYMGYDGIKSYPTCKDGIDHAERIIQWCEKSMAKV